MEKEKSRKIHKSCFSHGSLTSCGIIAYSPNHNKTSWKGVNCKNCLKQKPTKHNSRTIQSADEEVCKLCNGTGKTKKSIEVDYS